MPHREVADLKSVTVPRLLETKEPLHGQEDGVANEVVEPLLFFFFFRITLPFLLHHGQHLFGLFIANWRTALLHLFLELAKLHALRHRFLIFLELGELLRPEQVLDGGIVFFLAVFGDPGHFFEIHAAVLEHVLGTLQCFHLLLKQQVTEFLLLLRRQIEIGDQGPVHFLDHAGRHHTLSEPGNIGRFAIFF